MNSQPTERPPDLRTTHGTSLDDATIVRRIAERDETALATLYDRWVQQVYSLVVSMLRSPDRAEDVVEETFWLVWQRASSYDPARGSVASWLLTMSRKLALDRIRAKKGVDQVRVLSEEESVITAALESSNSQFDGEDGEQRSQALQALRVLSYEQRRILELAYYYGLSQAEIAEYLNQPLDAVKMQMQWGVQQLRDTLISSQKERV
jgi:RNA polymerase sigma-70 factor (ECF subfamily)